MSQLAGFILSFVWYYFYISTFNHNVTLFTSQQRCTNGFVNLRVLKYWDLIVFCQQSSASIWPTLGASSVRFHNLPGNVGTSAPVNAFLQLHHYTITPPYQILQDCSDASDLKAASLPASALHLIGVANPMGCVTVLQVYTISLLAFYLHVLRQR